ncbi:repetin-like [Ostrinia furnacalis]|uniref:repetin-like n=1 Tax=Ostrinia furnacalis TaxID=93504 RepID=UPI00103B2126|nr:repetin-like [Ostrinia furnacalis]
MHTRMYIFLLLLLLLSTDIALGSVNKTKTTKISHKHNSAKYHLKAHSDRSKRSIDDDDENPFWPNRGKKELNALINSEKESPFWATRGRRESSSVENYIDAQKPYKSYLSKNDRYCENCFPSSNSDEVYGNVKHTRDDVTSPFWGNRGRRSSEELIDNFLPESLFWGSRSARQENEPFWGNRGRRQDDPPFWGHRGRREDEPFWGNRGRREETPFWGHRGRRDDVDDPFWGNRGRRDDFEPFWGNRGRRKDSEPFWSSRGRRKEDLKDSILHAINNVENDIENLSRLKKSDSEHNSFWGTRPRDSKLKHLFDGPRNRPHALTTEPRTVHDNRIYAEEPHYIIVERNSRSSAEDDPFYISRGKKYYINLPKAARDRRGAIEEIVKSVRNDPFYIARGKKDDIVKVANTTMSHEEFVKAKELICATVELIMMKNENNKTKRDITDSERDRRTILKKLAAQLQMDPYFVSRGKKCGDSNNDDNLVEFINEVAGKCN